MTADTIPWSVREREIKRSWFCLCGESKEVGSLFCFICWTAAPLHLRDAMQRSPSENSRKLARRMLLKFAKNRKKKG